VLLLEAEHAKRKRRREVSMRQAVYDVLAALPGPHEGRVWPSGDIRTSFENAGSSPEDRDDAQEIAHGLAAREVVLHLVDRK
jgi:hypothetical protein